jgi:serine/threonine protein kinase
MTTHRPFGASQLNPGDRVGAYEIRRLLGRGTLSEVYRVYAPDLNTEMALKMLYFLPEDDAEATALRNRFAREMERVSILQHPNIARIYDYGEYNEFYFLIMELLESTSLRDLLSERRGGLPRDRALDIFRQIVDGVAFAHSKGIIHQDIRPGNILLADGGTHPVIVDFGLMRVLTNEGSTTAEFSPRIPLYMSPEQAAGNPVTLRSDIYSLGILLYEMVTGDVPFKGGTAARILVQHLQQMPRPPSELVADLDPRIESAIMQALAKNPEERFASPRDMLEVIDRQVDVKEYDTITLAKEDARAFRQQVQAAKAEAAVPAPEAGAGTGISRTTIILIAAAVVVVVIVIAVILFSQGGG